MPRFTILLRSLMISAALAVSLHADEWIRGIYTGESPEPVAVPAPLLQSAARAAAREFGDALVITGLGQSMVPLYPDGTVLIVAKRPYTSLTRGQTVVYLNRERRSVAHVLIARANDGWRVAGLNNRGHDGEGVKAENLVGVVVAAYTPSRR